MAIQCAVLVRNGMVDIGDKVCRRFLYLKIYSQMLSYLLLFVLVAILACLAYLYFGKKIKIGGGMTEMHVQEPWLSEIVSGRKTVEGKRGPASKFTPLIGQDVRFFNKHQSVVRRVVAVRHYDTLDQYLDAEWQAAAPHMPSKEAARTAYLAIRMKDGTQVFDPLPQGINAVVLSN